MLVIAAPLAVGLVILGLVISGSPDPSAPAIITNGPPTPMAPRPDKTAPKYAVPRVHRALHALGRICKPDDTANRASQVRPHVETILDFARRYPEVSFPIDDETGTTVTLLFVTRDSLRTCGPSLVERVNQALPPQYQSSEPTN